MGNAIRLPGVLFSSLLITAWLAGCATTRLSNDPGQMPERLDQPKDAAGRVDTGRGFLARLRPANGSAASGTVVIVERGGVMVVELHLTNAPPGFYSWALHERGNCTSRNGFSAGAPWVPPGTRRPAVELLPEFIVNPESTALVTVRVREARIEGASGVNGRAVLIYEGGDIKPLKADVPNNVIACGVFEPAQSWLL